MKELLLKLTEGKNLTQEEAFKAILTIMKNESDPAMTGAFLTALSIKGETPDEIVGAAKAMMEVAEIIEPHLDETDLLPCFATFTPAAATTIAETDEILNEKDLSPPVPTISSTS